MVDWLLQADINCWKKLKLKFLFCSTLLFSIVRPFLPPSSHSLLHPSSHSLTFLFIRYCNSLWPLNQATHLWRPPAGTGRTPSGSSGTPLTPVRFHTSTE